MTGTPGTEPGSPPAPAAPGTGVTGDRPGPGTPGAPLGIGVLGTASIARRRLLPAFAQDPGTRIVAIASRDAGRAQDLASRYGAAGLDRYEAVLESSAVQAVYIPLPVALHAEWVEKALLAGKHVLAEKPLTMSAATTGHLLALAASRSLVLTENFMFLHHGQHRKVSELLTEGAVGDLRGFTGTFGIPAPPAGDIRHRLELGGGALLDVAVQPIMVALHHLGSDLQVEGFCQDTLDGSGVDTGGAVLLATPDGRVTAQVAYGMDHAYRADCEWWGRDGRISMERAYAPAADQVPTLLLRTGTGTERITLDPEDQCRAAVRAFAESVRRGDAGAGPTRSLALARVLDAVRRHRPEPGLRTWARSHQRRGAPAAVPQPAHR